jgi:hypothetical protein
MVCFNKSYLLNLVTYLISVYYSVKVVTEQE